MPRPLCADPLGHAGYLVGGEPRRLWSEPRARLPSEPE